MQRARALILTLSALATSAAAQSLNVDVGSNVAFPTPPAAYAAAGSAGTWNAVDAPANAVALVALDGSPSGVTVSSSGGYLTFDYDNAATTGSDEALLDDSQDLGGGTDVTTWTFNGLASGDYRVITYAWAPDMATFLTHVVVPGSSDAAQDVGGTWTGSHQLGVTYALHHVHVSSGSLSIVLTVGFGFGTLNGFQLVREPSFAIVCAGDGSGAACPCGNASASGSGDGCLNSLGTAGRLRASGTASIAGDTLLLTGSGMPNASVLYFQGTSALAGGAGAVFGDGLRCAGGSVTRLGQHVNSGGGSAFPSGADPAIHVKGGVSASDVRTYQAWYRNSASFCAPEGFNLTNGVQVTWAP